MDSVDGGCPPFIVPFRFVRVRWGFAKSFFLSSFNSFIYNTIESPPPPLPTFTILSYLSLSDDSVFSLNRGEEKETRRKGGGGGGVVNRREWRREMGDGVLRGYYFHGMDGWITLPIQSE